MGIANTVNATSVASHIQRPESVGPGATRRSEAPGPLLGPAVVTDFSSHNLETRRAVRGVNRTFDLLEEADATAEMAEEGVARLRELAGHAGNPAMPRSMRAEAAAEFEAVLADLQEMAFGANAAGTPVADGSARKGTVGSRDEALPPTDLRLENLGLSGMDRYTLFSATGQADVARRLEGASAEIAAQRAEIGAAAQDVAEAGPPLPSPPGADDEPAAPPGARSTGASAEAPAPADAFVRRLAEAVHQRIVDRHHLDVTQKTHDLDHAAVLRVLG